MKRRNKQNMAPKKRTKILSKVYYDEEKWKQIGKRNISSLIGKGRRAYISYLETRKQIKEAGAAKGKEVI